MKLTHYDIGNREKGETVEVILSGKAVANVSLMDSSNFDNYKNGSKHTYYGGVVQSSPIRLDIPVPGHWHAIVELHELSVKTRSKASIKVIASPVPIYREPALSSIPSLFRQEEDNSSGNKDRVSKKYDVFISHITEDKDSLAIPLAEGLKNAGLRVWHDEYELKSGDSLREKIDAGLANSRFGIVALSHYFFKKNWPQHELDELVTQEITGEQIILPILHNISKQEVMSYSPSLAYKLARSTSTRTVQEIAAEIAELFNSGSK